VRMGFLKACRGGLFALATFSVGPTRPAEVRRFAVLVGVSEYPDGIPGLRSGPLNDVTLVRELLIHRLGFPPAEIVTLTDSAASRGRVAAAIREHLGQAGPNDVALFYYSGHGIQLDAATGLSGALDSEPDSLDEALLLWSADGKRATYLLDDEIGVLLDGLRSRSVIAIIDACHSGTAARGASDAPLRWSELGRAQPPRGLRETKDPQGDFRAKRVLRSELPDGVDAPAHLLTEQSLPRQRNHLVLAAAQDSEIAWSAAVTFPDGSAKPLGLFTAALYQSVRTASPSTSINTIMIRVATLVDKISRRNQGVSQSPKATGDKVREPLGKLFGLAPAR
jgi:hypothetical protein